MCSVLRTERSSFPPHVEDLESIGKPGRQSTGRESSGQDQRLGLGGRSRAGYGTITNRRPSGSRCQAASMPASGTRSVSM